LDFECHVDNEKNTQFKRLQSNYQVQSATQEEEEKDLLEDKAVTSIKSLAILFFSHFEEIKERIVIAD
jgi:hypothetical protein